MTPWTIEDHLRVRCSSRNMPTSRVHQFPSDPGDEAAGVTSPYQRLLYSVHNDPRWMADVNLGKRVAFYRFRGDLGSGNFSQVKLAIHQLCKERVAVKILDKSKLDQKTRRMLAREIATMEAIHHQNIIRLYEVVETYSKIHLVMEYASGGELFNRITIGGRIPEQDAKMLFAQVMSAISYMHERNFIHRDIKAENVFFAAPGLVKLGDFGFSTELSIADQQLTTFCGSPPYAAPELFKDESYLGAPVDMWAAGVLLYFMVTGQMPFKAQTVASLKKYIIDGNYSVPSHVSPECRKLIEGILKQAPTERLTPSDVRDSEWLKGIPYPSCPGLSEQYSLRPTLLTETSSAASKQATVDSVAMNGGPSSDPSNIERQALDKLQALGITREILAEHQDRGARSSVIGAYRIMIHRLQRQESLAGEIEALVLTDMENNESCSTLRSANASGHNFCLSALSRRSKSAGGKVRSDKKTNKNRSRTCVLL